MRILRNLVFLALVLILTSAVLINPGSSFAQQIGTGYVSAIRVQNLSSTTAAKCTIHAYDETSGTEKLNTALSDISPSAAGYVYTPATKGDTANGGLPSDTFPTGSFAVSIECDQDVSAVVTYSSDTQKMGDAFVGVKQTDLAKVLYISNAYNNYYGYYTSIRIQNPTTASQTVKVEYFGAGSSTAVASENITIPANGAKTVDQKGNTNLTANTFYSAKVTGTDNLAVLGLIYGGPSNIELYTLPAFKSGTTTAINAPVIMADYYGYTTATVIQNAGTAATDVKITYSDGTVRQYTKDNNGAGKGDGSKLAAGAAWAYTDYQDTALKQNTLYGSKIESVDGQPLIVTVNESKNGSIKVARAAAFPGSDVGAKTAIAPTVMRNYYNYNTSITCVGVGTSGITNGKIRYVGTNLDNTKVDTTQTVGTDGIIYTPNVSALKDGFIGAATITADNDFVCVVNSDQDANTSAYDYLGAFNGIFVN